VADIFISYASEDREWAVRLSRAFESIGWSVWWDRDLLVGESFDLTIQRELDHAKVVVVLWSGLSVNRAWVRNEARYAAERGVLAPARIADVKLPLEFSDKQTANLIGWKGGADHDGLQKLCQSIRAVVEDGLDRKANFANKPKGRSVDALAKSWNFRVLFLVPFLLIAVFAAGYIIFEWTSRGNQVYKELSKAEGQAASSGDAAKVEKTLQSIQKAADDFPGDGRFQRLFDETRKVASDIRLRDETYTALANAEKQAAASGDSAQVAKSLDSIQKAADDFPGDGRFQRLFDETRKVASDMQHTSTKKPLLPLPLPRSTSRNAVNAFEARLGYSPNLIKDIQSTVCIENPDGTLGPIGSPTRMNIVEFFRGFGTPREDINLSGLTPKDVDILQEAFVQTTGGKGCLGLGMKSPGMVGYYTK
jgi:hypothetical protein